MKSEISVELVKKYYALLFESIVQRMAETGAPLTEVTEQVVRFFGLIPAEGRENVYQLTPDLRKAVDAASLEAKIPSIPPHFTEDQALVFCAVQIAGLQQQGKLESLTAEVEKMLEDMKAKLGQTTEVKASEIPIVALAKTKRKSFSDDDDGPTFH